MVVNSGGESLRHDKVKHRVVGTRPIRHDGLDKVTGRAQYGADINFPGLLHGKMHRSPHAHARILSIDTSKAEALPGVKAVITASSFAIIKDQVIDLAETMGNLRVGAENCLAHDKVLYKGHAVAAVAATNAHIAEQAIELIDVDYEVLPTVLTLHDAMKEEAPLLHEKRLTTHSLQERFARGTDTGEVSNIAGHFRYERGDTEQGFKEAAIVVEREFTTKTVHQGYIEPHTSTGLWGHDGAVTIWTSTQGSFGIRAQTAAMLGIAESKVKVVPMEIGGGFGGKIPTYLDPIVALLSKKSGRPVKMVMTRKEVLEGTGPAAATHMRLKMGADGDGRITAADFYLAFEAGAYPGSPVGAGVSTGLAPYKIDNLVVNGYDVVCNKPKVAAYRAPGSPQAAFAVEQVVDELADKLGIDPIDFRLTNAAYEGVRLPSGVPHPRIACVEVAEEMRSHPHYKSPLGGPNRGRGVAVGYWFNNGMASSATINVNTDGTISLLTGSVDIGGSRPALAMQAAEILGLDAEDVSPSVADTDSVGWTAVTGGSRTTFSTGIAVITAAEGVKQQMAGRAALIWETQPESVEFKDGVFFSTKNPNDRLTFKELAGKLMITGGPVTESAHSNPRQVGPGIAGNMVDVEVDPETGKVTILRYTAVQDVGRAVHPSYVEGQMQGGAVQGIGWALNEEYYYTEDGTLANSSFLDYRMPTSLDVPMIDTTIVEVPNDGHPFGVKGVGEAAIVPPMAAIANAVYRATGVRMTQLPMSPGAVLAALEKGNSTG